MKTKPKQTGTCQLINETDEELADVLTAISVVSKRLARKLTILAQQNGQIEKGVKTDGQDK